MVDVISGYFPSLRREEEKGIRGIARDFDIGFITDLGDIGVAFKMKVKPVTEVSSVEGIVEYGLVGKFECKYISKDEGGFACRDAE